MNTTKLIAVCILCLYLAVIPAVAQENDMAVDETVAMATPTTEPTAVLAGTIAGVQVQSDDELVRNCNDFKK